MTPPVLAIQPLVLDGVLAALGVSALLSFIRLLKGPTLPDRVMALDLMALIAVGAVVVLAIDLEQRVFVDVAITLALVAFMTTVAFARYLDRMGRDG